MNTTPAIATADGILASVLRTIGTQLHEAVASGVTAYIDRSDTVYIPTGTANAQGSTACIRRTDMPAAPRVSVAFGLGISAVNSTQNIGAVL